jgi:hypothetical protein
MEMKIHLVPYAEKIGYCNTRQNFVSLRAGLYGINNSHIVYIVYLCAVFNVFLYLVIYEGNKIFVGTD